MGPGPGPLGELAERLRALGTDPSARELAEALWLAGHVAPAATAPPSVDATPAPMDVPQEPEAVRPPADLPARPGPEEPAPAPGPTRLHPDDPRPRTAMADPERDETPVRVRVPMATALPRPLRLQRALRPLQRYHPPVRAVSHLLDEQATAERAAETGLLLPVLRPVVRRRARLRLLMDASTSTGVWDTTLAELSQICAGTGAFREVQVHYAHEGAGGDVLLGPSRTPDRALRAAEQLRDPTGHQLTLVLSDCAGPLWSDGRMQRLLYDWAQAAPVALVQPLPQRMWRRTHLPALPGTLRRREGLGARLEFTGPGGSLAGLPVPVLGLAPTAFGAWARLLSGNTGLTLPAAAGWVYADHGAAPVRGPAQPPAPEDLVDSFRRTASRQAVQLAVALSAVPLTVPVMQLVQRAMLPDTGPSVLAEVLLSGLLRRGPEEGWYAFLPGVRELLLTLLPKGDALLILRQCGDYVERHFGRRAHNFPAIALAELTGGEAGVGENAGVPGAFAEVSELVARRYGKRDGRPGRAPAPQSQPHRESFRLLYAGYDRPWAAWVERELTSYGHEVVLVRWAPAPEQSPLDALATVRDLDFRKEHQPGRTLLLLSGALLPQGGRPAEDWSEAFARLAEGTPGLFVGLALDEDAWATGLALDPALLTGVDETRARHRLLARLSLGVTADRVRPPTARFPGLLPETWSGVPPRLAGFVGRDEVLEALPERLRQARRADAACVLTGASGCGKTAIAVEYAHRYSSEYDAVWWLREGMEINGFVGTADDRHLVVIDEWADHETLRSVLMSSFLGRVHVLVVSVLDDWPPEHRVTRVGAFARRESVAFFLRNSPMSVTEAETFAAAHQNWPGAMAGMLSPAGRPLDGDVDDPQYAVSRLVNGSLVSLTAIGAYGSGGISGTGFFIAPGWVLTCAHVASRARSFVVTTVDGRSVEGQTERVFLPTGRKSTPSDDPNFGLVRVPPDFEHECVRLSDGETPGPSLAVQLFSFATAGPGPRRQQLRSTRPVEGRWANKLRLAGGRIPPGGSGGPVVDVAGGAVVGVLSSITEDSDGTWFSLAEPIGQLRSWAARGGEGAARLWSDIVRAHDHYHLARLLDPTAGLSWTVVQIRAHQGSAGTERDFSPGLRTRLYGLLAELFPPSGVYWARELVERSRAVPTDLPYTPDEPFDWRDGVIAVHSPPSGDLRSVLLYAAHVWAHCAQRKRDLCQALARLRSWVEDTAARSLDENTRRQVTAALDAGRATARAHILVEVRFERAGYTRRLSRRRGNSAHCFAEPGEELALGELRKLLRAELDKELDFSELHDESVRVDFSLPLDLLAEPVEDWRVGAEQLGQRCRVGVAPEWEEPFEIDDAERLLRWAAVNRGALRPLLLTHEPGVRGKDGEVRAWIGDSADVQAKLMTAPLSVVPVYCGSLAPGVGRDLPDVVLGTGCGLVLWRRVGDGDHTDCAAFLGKAAQLLRGARSADEVLTRVRELRRRGDDPDAAWAQGIAVLYDPPVDP